VQQDLTNTAKGKVALSLALALVVYCAAKSFGNFSWMLKTCFDPRSKAQVPVQASNTHVSCE